MEPCIVLLERDSIVATFGRPSRPHRWVEHSATTPGELVERLAGAQVAVVNKLRIGEVELSRLPELRLIALTATGTDNIDLAACRARGVLVCNVRGYATAAVPEHVMMLMLALSRRLPDYQADVRAGRWQRARSFCLLGHPITDLAGSLLGIVGRGSLGQGVARLAEAFGMRVAWAERRGAAGVREGYTAFETVLREADVLSLHCPLTEHTRHLIDASALAAMKPTARLINTARGALVDEAALAEALRERTIAGAAVDVLSEEPPAHGNPLLAADIPNLIVTPHVAWASAGAMQALADQAIDNIDAWLAGTPRHLVG